MEKRHRNVLLGSNPEMQGHGRGGSHERREKPKAVSEGKRETVSSISAAADKLSRKTSPSGVDWNRAWQGPLGPGNFLELAQFRLCQRSRVILCATHQTHRLQRCRKPTFLF